jgi:hypothetical protein
VVLVALAGLLLARDLLAVRQSLVAAQASLAEVRSAAGRDRRRERGRLARPRRPQARRSAVAERRTAVVARDRAPGRRRQRQRDPWCGPGRQRRARRRPARGRRAATSWSAPGSTSASRRGRSTSRPLEQARAVLADLPLAQLIEARDELRATEPGWAPQELLDGRRDTLRLADEAIGSIERGRELLAVLPSFLGTDGTAQLLPRGADPGRAARDRRAHRLLRRPHGRGRSLRAAVPRRCSTPSTTSTATRPGRASARTRLPTRPRRAGHRPDRLSGDRSEGATVDDEFRERYDHTSAAGLFSNVNVDPDLPTTARIALDLFDDPDRRRGSTAWCSPTRSRSRPSWHAAGGEIEVPSVDAGEVELPATIDPAASPSSSPSTSTTSSARVAARTASCCCAPSVTSPSRPCSTAPGTGCRCRGRSARRRANVTCRCTQRHDHEQQAFEALGVAGALRATDGADLLAGHRQQRGRRQAGRPPRSPRRRRRRAGRPRDATDDARSRCCGGPRCAPRSTTRCPAEGMDEYVIGNCLVGGDRNQCFDGPPGENRTWFSRVGRRRHRGGR